MIEELNLKNEIFEKYVQHPEYFINLLESEKQSIKDSIASYREQLRGIQIDIRSQERNQEDSEKKEILHSQSVQLSREIRSCNRFLSRFSEVEKPSEEQDSAKHFDKHLCFSNIRFLMEEKDIKIGQIEREAGCRLGYMSRLDKIDNSSQPTLEFVATAAEILNVSIDYLLNYKIEDMSPTEKYLFDFISKLIQDTNDGELAWKTEMPHIMNNCEYIGGSRASHPMFELLRYKEEGVAHTVKNVERLAFSSKTFGPQTYINGNCYTFSLSNNSTLYIMDICKFAKNMVLSEFQAKEVWILKNNGSKTFIGSDQGSDPLSKLIVKLYEAVKEGVKHPQISKDIRDIIDNFMIGDDLPF